ncbi:MAG: hypothetical protein KBT36_09485 [Kurthia sp.]|nr:hypothetical protein [Candidatus Kurthia equi]
MKITEKDIPNIEKVLGLKLCEHQINYLLNGEEIPKEMQTGSEAEKRVAYSIKLLLSEGTTLNLNKPEQFADQWALEGEERLFYAKKFKREFIPIWSKLHSSDFRWFPIRNVWI